MAESIEVPHKTIEGRDFYEAMQTYRHTPLIPPQDVLVAYQNVIKVVNDKVQPLVSRAVELRENYLETANDTKSESEREYMLGLIAEIDAELEVFKNV